MIFSSTLLLALAVFNLSLTSAAPIGRRDLDVRAMRRSMEAAPAPDVTARSHHSARSYVPGGGNDPSLQARNSEASNSNINKRDEADKPTWRREKLPRHVRDTMARKRDIQPPPEKVARAELEATTPVVAREETAINVPREEPTTVQARDESKLPRDKIAAPVTRSTTENTVEKREPIRPIATFKRALESLD